MLFRSDEFGHGAGDLVLRSFAECIRGAVRASDLPCRYGGEELAVVLPDADLGCALHHAEELRRAIRNMALRHKDTVLGTVTASFGVAEFPRHGANMESLLRAGDAALYRAKHGGRDRVCSAEA